MSHAAALLSYSMTWTIYTATDTLTYPICIYVHLVLSRLLTVVAVGHAAMAQAWPSKLEEFGSAIYPRKE